MRTGARSVRDRAVLVATLVVAAIVTAACAGGTATSSPGAPRPLPVLSPELGIDLGEYTRAGPDLYFKDVTIGTGAVAGERSRVTVAYRGVLATGVQVDSSAGLTLRMSDAIIKGWKLGIPGMREGGARILVIPPELGYGFKEVGAIPPNSTLVFRIQLVRVQ